MEDELNLPATEPDKENTSSKKKTKKEIEIDLNDTLDSIYGEPPVKRL